MTETTTTPGDARANVADVEEALRDVVDPELGINVVDLGLIYGITVDQKPHAVIDMTLTSAACPLTDVIEDQTAQALDGLVPTATGSTGCGCRRGARTRSPTTAASSCAPSASTSDPARSAVRRGHDTCGRCRFPREPAPAAGVVRALFDGGTPRHEDGRYLRCSA